MNASQVFFIAVTGWLTKLSWSKSEEYVGGFFSILLSVIFGFLFLVVILTFIADFMSIEATPRNGGNPTVAPRTRRNQRAAAPRTGGGNQRIESLHASVLGAFYHRKKGGVIISCGNNHMMAIEFDGPLQNGGIYGEMAYVFKGNSRSLVSQGIKFLNGETFDHIKCDENDFISLLSKYNKQARFTGQTDVKSGLRLYSVRISK